MASRRLVIVGAGGFAREVAWLVRELNAASASKKLRRVKVLDWAMVEVLSRACRAGLHGFRSFIDVRISGSTTAT